VREKYCWLVADKPSEQAEMAILCSIRLTLSVKCDPEIDDAVD
jgi:hypothetical protein